MIECYSCLLLLLLFIRISSLGATHRNEFLLVNRTIEHVCENDILYLHCSKPNETLQIIRSMYGRTSQRICNEKFQVNLFEKTCANIEQSKNQIKHRCQGKSTCQLLISNQIFTDPCGKQISKHFEVHYRCINQEEICSKLILNCSQTKDLDCIRKLHDEFSCRCPSTICQYVNNQLIGFIEQTCPHESIWTKTSINQIQTRSCPLPCYGQIKRSCQSNQQWSTIDYTDCHCEFTQLSTNHFSIPHIFECKNLWLINRLLPKDNSCLLTLPDVNDDQPLACLKNSFQSCSANFSSMAIDFENLRMKIVFPLKRSNHLKFSSYEVDFHRTKIIDDNFRQTIPLMFIETRPMNSTKYSFYLIEQKNDLESLQTGNITITFHPESFNNRYQCRAHHSTNLNQLNTFFACQIICLNATQVICQCPFYNPMMFYSLYIDEIKTENEILIDQDLNNQCLEKTNRSIDRYLNEIPSVDFAKKILFLIEKQLKTFNNKFVQQFEQFASRFINQTDQFAFIGKNLDFYIKSIENQFTNTDQSISISLKSNYRIQFSTLNFADLFPSRIVYLNIDSEKNSSFEITFRHLHSTNSNSICGYLDQHRWKTDICLLKSTNITHTICQCQTKAQFFGLINRVKQAELNWQLFLVPKLGCCFSLICLLLTISILIIQRSSIHDDFLGFRNIFHLNMLVCLILVEILFLFGINQYENQILCRIISILIDYFLLTTFSWMFADEIELLIGLKQDFKFDRIRLLAYSIYSYLFPLVTILFSVQFSPKSSANRYCWLAYENTFLWAFAVPFILLMIGNFCFFLISIYSICRNTSRNDSKDSIRFSLRNLSLISILFGLTWIFALFYLYDQSRFFASIFTLFNCTHCSLILIFYYIIYRTTNKFDSDKTTSSSYSSEHSTDLLNKENFIRNDYDKQFDTCYLPSIPVHLLSTFRYDEMILSHEQLLEKPTNHDDEHQYYEIS